MERCKVFYSWQSDSPPASNRNFILKALENAAKVIREDDTIEVEPVVDRDTAGVPGAPDIAAIIFEKIDQAQVFVCDVTLINPGSTERLTSNPNILIELGYAIKKLGFSRIIMIMNIAFGPPEDLPFDLRMRRVLTYRMEGEAPERAPERRKLQSALEAALRAILEGLGERALEGGTRQLIPAKGSVGLAADLGDQMAALAGMFQGDLWRAKPQEPNYADAIRALIDSTWKRVQEFRWSHPGFLALPEETRGRFEGLLRSLHDLRGRTDDGVWYAGFTVLHQIRQLAELIRGVRQITAEPGTEADRPRD